MPLTVNSVLLKLALLTVTLEPVAVRVAVCVALWPTTMLPKLIEPGLTESCPGVLDDPESAIARVGFEALEITFRLPLALPPACGVNVTLNVRL